MQQELETVTKLVDTLVEFAVKYGFQILGALVFLIIGLKVAAWIGGRVTRVAETRNVDETLSRFIGNVIRLVVIAFVAIITLGNFGISTAPLIALAGASAFGATLAMQGPLSNYGAGLSIILSRPFGIGDTVSVKNVSGTVEEIALSAVVLVGEDGERIRVPNKEIVGEIIVNSREHRIVETRIAIEFTENAENAISVLRQILRESPKVGDKPSPQVGVHDFTYGGVVIGLRFWVPSREYFQARYAVNESLMYGLREAGIGLMPTTGMAIAAQHLSADAEN
jgi:small conductance mechanosensitive channel